MTNKMKLVDFSQAFLQSDTICCSLSKQGHTIFLKKEYDKTITVLVSETPSLEKAIKTHNRINEEAIFLHLQKIGCLGPYWRGK